MKSHTTKSKTNSKSDKNLDNLSLGQLAVIKSLVMNDVTSKENMGSKGKMAHGHSYQKRIDLNRKMK